MAVAKTELSQFLIHKFADPKNTGSHVLASRQVEMYDQVALGETSQAPCPPQPPSHRHLPEARFWTATDYWWEAVPSSANQSFRFIDCRDWQPEQHDEGPNEMADVSSDAKSFVSSLEPIPLLYNWHPCAGLRRQAETLQNLPDRFARVD
jgi:hypothetical protein